MKKPAALLALLTLLAACNGTEADEEEADSAGDFLSSGVENPLDRECKNHVCGQECSTDDEELSGLSEQERELHPNYRVCDPRGRCISPRGYSKICR